MNARLCGIVSMVSLVLVGCHPSSKEKMSGKSDASKDVVKADESPKRILGLPEGWELAPDAKYAVHQTEDEVIIRATGENPTPGYEVKLYMSPLRIYPPQWMLARKAPSGIVTQVITPFDTTAKFKAEQEIRTVRISDGAGQHDVRVDHIRD